MDLTRRKAVLGLGAAVLAPLLAPGEAAACLFGHRKHRRVIGCQPNPCEPTSYIKKSPACVEYVGSILFAPSCCQFKLGTAVKFTINAAPGSSFQLNQTDVVDLNPFTGATTSIGWTLPAFDASTNGSRLVVWSTPFLKSGMPMPTTTSHLTITIHSNFAARCDQTSRYVASYIA